MALNVANGDSGVPVVYQSVKNQTDCIHEDVVSLTGLAEWLRIWHCPKLRCRSQMQLRSYIPVTVIPIRPLAWELPHVAGAALKRKKKKERKKEKKMGIPIFKKIKITNTYHWIKLTCKGLFHI